MTKRYKATVSTYVEGKFFREDEEIRGVTVDEELAKGLVKAGNIEEIKVEKEEAVAFADVAPSEAVMSQTIGVKPIDSKGKTIETENKVPTDPSDNLTSAASAKKD